MRTSWLLAAVLCLGCANTYSIELDPNNREQIDELCGTNTYYIVCDNACTDATQNENCGQCGQTCGEIATCQVPTQPQSQNSCDADDTCDDATTDHSAHKPGTCVCNEEGLTFCTGECLDTRHATEHCGDCDNNCLTRPNVDQQQTTCANGSCKFTCQTGFFDCNTVADDGCEVDLLNDVKNCGTCGHACADDENCSNGACSICPAGFVLINAGSYTIGSDATEFGRATDSSENQRKVEISYDYCIMAFELSTGEYNAAVKGSVTQNNADLPKANLSWHDAAYVANRLSKSNDLPECYTCELAQASTPDNPTPRCQAIDDFLTCTGYRLPTDAEWEVAARGGTNFTLYNAEKVASTLDELSALVKDIAWMADTEKTVHNRADSLANSYHANPKGLYDVAGNLYEWTHDKFYLPQNNDENDPLYPATSPDDEHLLRGGSYMSSAIECRHAARAKKVPATTRSSVAGARLVIRPK